jgi:hypothetical protein
MWVRGKLGEEESAKEGIFRTAISIPFFNSFDRVEAKNAKPSHSGWTVA